MKRFALLVLAAAMAAVPISLGAGPAGPAAAEDPLLPQTVEFTSEPPADAVWGRYGYWATAASSSGLPVTITVDPASTGCTTFPAPPGAPFQNIALVAPGSCIVHADQAGDATYAPAQRVTQTFTVGRAWTSLAAAKVRRGVVNLTPAVFRATLTRREIFGPGEIAVPYAGQEVAFRIGTRTVCTATTAADGVATCRVKLAPRDYFTAQRYTAVYGGSALFAPSTADGRIVWAG